jgi:phosphatidylinositol-3,4,5-trisphosphate 3-phosphatase/dual-specificity protein phosphatase PTEN
MNVNSLFKNNPFVGLFSKSNQKASEQPKEPSDKNEINLNTNTNSASNSNNTLPSVQKKKIKMFEDDNQSQEIEEPVKPLSSKETEEILKDPKFSKVKALKEKTDKEFLKTVTNKNQAGFMKSLVSQDKTRFCYDGFDLDLTYITPRIIAMGYPSKNIEGIYRNNMEDVKNFFMTRHPNHYKVYNLCEERNYKDCFYKQGYFPFKDHEAPPLNLIKPFCEDVKKFLDEDEKNVVAIHCLAGKGRTGTFICCLLLYLNFFETAEECLLYYGLLRVGTVKGVTVPSQMRYVHYFEYILKNKLPDPIIFKKVVLRKLKMYTIPKVGKKFQPNFVVDNLKKSVKYSDIMSRKESYGFDLDFIEFPLGAGGIAVSGDVRIQFYQMQFLNLKSEKLFKFWFNTNFMPENGVFEIKKEEIDKACKDKECKTYKKEFKIELEFIYL